MCVGSVCGARYGRVCKVGGSPAKIDLGFRATL